MEMIVMISALQKRQKCKIISACGRKVFSADNFNSNFEWEESDNEVYEAYVLRLTLALPHVLKWRYIYGFIK
jgi:hypothetical protein